MEELDPVKVTGIFRLSVFTIDRRIVHLYMM